MPSPASAFRVSAAGAVTVVTGLEAAASSMAAAAIAAGIHEHEWVMARCGVGLNWPARFGPAPRCTRRLPAAGRHRLLLRCTDGMADVAQGASTLPQSSSSLPSRNRAPKVCSSSQATR